MSAVVALHDDAGVVSVPLDEPAFCARVFEAKTGERIEYHRGFLALDRARASNQADRTTRSAIARTADRAFALAEKGAVHLVQKRLAPECFSYLAVVKPRRKRAKHQLTDLPVEEPA